MKKMNVSLVLTLFSAAVFLNISGCCGGRESVHVLNMKVYPSNGFVNADSLPRRADVMYPNSLIVVNELPGSGTDMNTRKFTASPIRLQKVGANTNAGKVGVDYDRIEKNKFLVVLQNAHLVKGLPSQINPNTIAILTYVGRGEPFCSWERDSVDTGVNTLKLVVNARGCRQANGAIVNPDWICSDLVSKSILKVQPGQRIPRIP